MPENCKQCEARTEQRYEAEAAFQHYRRAGSRMEDLKPIEIEAAALRVALTASQIQDRINASYFGAQTEAARQFRVSHNTALNQIIEALNCLTRAAEILEPHYFGDERDAMPEPAGQSSEANREG